jgi:hypothetical protein
MAMYAQVGKDWVARAAELGLSKEDVSGWRQPYNELAIFKDRARKNPEEFVMVGIRGYNQMGGGRIPQPFTNQPR